MTRECRPFPSNDHGDCQEGLYYLETKSQVISNHIKISNNLEGFCELW